MFLRISRLVVCSPVLVILLLVSSSRAGVSQSQAKGAQSSTTTFTVSPDGSVVDAGSRIVLTSMVESAGSPVRHGVVLFCDAKAAVCRDSALLGEAQLTANGTATVRLKFGAGSYAIKAVFEGTPRSNPPVAASASEARTLKVVIPNAK